MPAPRPYGRGPYGTGAYSAYSYLDVGGVAQVALTTEGTLLRTWQQPTAMCSAGTWTLTTLPTGPINDQLELVA